MILKFLWDIVVMYGCRDAKYHFYFSDNQGFQYTIYLKCVAFQSGETE